MNVCSFWFRVNGLNESRFTRGVAVLHEPSEPQLLRTTVRRADVVDFARAIGETRPQYVDAQAARRAGHPDVLAPPTFLFCLTLRVDDPWAWARDAGFDMARTLHGEQSFDYHRPVHAGDVLTLSATSEAAEPVGAGLRRLRRRTQVSCAGRRVAQLVTTLVTKEPSA
jgi:acyl dehydratase